MSLYKIQKLSKDTHNAKKGSSCKTGCKITSNDECESSNSSSSSNECGSNNASCSSSSSSGSDCEPDTNYSPVCCEKPECCKIEIKEPLECPEFKKCERKPMPVCEHKHKPCRVKCGSDSGCESESECEPNIPCCPGVPDIKLPEKPCSPKRPKKPKCNFSPIRMKTGKCCKIKKCCKLKKLSCDDSFPCIKVRKPEKIKPVKDCNTNFPSIPDCNFGCEEKIEKPRMPHKAKVCTSKCSDSKNTNDDVHQIERLQLPKIKDAKF
jgi:hypothetical protein